MAKIDELINEFLNNELNDEGKQKLTSWLAESASNKDYFKKIESLYNATGIIGNPQKFSSDYKNSKLQIQILHDKNVLKIKKRYVFYNVASVAAVMVFAIIFFFSTTRVDIENEKCTTLLQEVVTPKGSKSQLVLSDGTKIWLNADSKLVYPGSFNDKKREVKLVGEAYFEVKTNKEKPFYVQVGEINVKATGTSFNVKNYPEENIIETTLLEGEVIIESALKGGNSDKQTELMTLKPNEKITLFKKKDSIEERDYEDKTCLQDNLPSIETISRAVVTENVDMKKTLSWRNNKVIFENESFADIVNQLERRFGVKFIFSSERAKQISFTGTFDEISIEGALEAMSFASPFNYQIENDSIIITN